MEPKPSQPEVGLEMMKGAAAGGGLAMVGNAALCAIGMCVTGGTLALVLAGAACAGAIAAGDKAERDA